MAEDEADLIEIDMAELKKMKVGHMSLEGHELQVSPCVVSTRLPTLRRR